MKHWTNTTSLEARDIPYGLGCGGVLDVLLEPVVSSEASAMLRALEAAQRGETLFSATVLPSSARNGLRLARVTVREDGALVFASSHLDAETRAHLASMARIGNEAKTVSISLVDEERNVFLSRSCRRNGW